MNWEFLSGICGFFSLLFIIFIEWPRFKSRIIDAKIQIVSKRRLIIAYIFSSIGSILRFFGNLVWLFSSFYIVFDFDESLGLNESDNNELATAIFVAYFIMLLLFFGPFLVNLAFKSISFRIDNAIPKYHTWSNFNKWMLILTVIIPIIGALFR